jgi:hypothetical protein
MTTSLSSSRAELLSRAASRSPARAIASGGEGRGARPRAADDQLVGGGQGVCALPESKGGRVIGGEVCVPGGGREGTRRQRRHARSGPDSRLGGQGHARGAHLEHVAHGRDAGGVEAQRLVEGVRGLPSRREGMRCGEGEVRAGRREGLGCGGGTQEACTGPDSRLGGQGHARSARRTCRSWS